VSIQGLVGPYAPYVFGSLSPHELLATHGPLALLRGDCAWGAYREFMRQAPRERDIIASADAVAGRTDWDIAHSRAMAPQCRYFHVGELLRKPFHEARWALADCQRHSIMVTNARAPMRGFETVLDAVAVLRQSYPDIRVRLAAGIAGRYGSFLRRRIDRLGLSDRVELLGWLDGEQLAAALVKSHCYVMASHVENSPNSLCEAQLVGMPCVASYAGGISSLLEHGRTGLFFPVGDGAVLAHRLRTIFQDDSLAQRLGAAARAEAAQRHDPKRVVDELMQAYRAAAGARSD
jgi:glycosyltransferase involved in cell wall biosynthesis